MAITLLALATIVAVGSLPTCTILSNKGRFQEGASLLAQSLLEKQRARPWSQLPTPPFREVMPPVVLAGTGTAMRPVLEVYAVGTLDVDKLRRVVITVEWKEKQGQRKLSHETDLVHLQQ